MVEAKYFRPKIVMELSSSPALETRCLPSDCASAAPKKSFKDTAISVAIILNLQTGVCSW